MKYSIDFYGAKTDGKLYTAEIQKAIDDCYINGGGEVIVPEGTYRTGGIRLRSGVTLHLMENAVLEGSTDPEDYLAFLEDTIEPIDPEDIDKQCPTVVPGTGPARSAQPYSRWNNAIIRAIKANDIAIIGEKGSIINGKNCYDEKGEEGYRGPHAINFWYCENIELKGYTIQDSANWAHAIQNSKNIHISDVTVLAGHDGFDVRTCDNILIDHCDFYSGDDCVAGFDNIDVTVRDCVFNTACNVLRFGGTNVLVENCKSIAPAKYGHRYGLTEEQKRNGNSNDENCRHNCLTAFFYYCDTRAMIRETPGDITIRSCHFINAETIFKLPFGHIWCRNRSLDSITFEDCIFDGVCAPIEISCPAEEPITFTLKNCIVNADEKGKDLPFATLENFRDFVLDNVKINNYTNPEIICKTQGNVSLINTVAQISK